MNDEELQNEIKKIKNEKMRSYLLECLEREDYLNLNLSSVIVEKATQRFENKIKACVQIENDLPNQLIPDGDRYLLNVKLDTLIEHNYKEMKFFISKGLNLNSYQLKLNYFYLAIKLLEKIKTGKKESHCDKEFIGALDLLQKFVTEKKYIPNEEDLKYISNLYHGSNESDIRKSFYGIIHELDDKLLFQDLLKQLLEIIKNKNHSPLLLFSRNFIEMCLADTQMDASGLYQAIHTIYSALIEYNTQVIVIKNLIDLNQFEKDKREKISRSITDNLANQSSQKQESVQVALILKEIDFGTFFTTDVNNEKIKFKLYQAKVDYNKLFKITTDNSSSKFFGCSWGQISSIANKIMEKGKAITAGAVENLEGFAATSSNLVTSLIKKNSRALNSQTHEDTDKIDLNNSLTQAKEKLLSIKEKLNIWSSILNYPIKSHIIQQNQIDIGQINITEVIAVFDASINEKYSSWSTQILAEFEKTNTNIKEKDYWLAESANNKISLVYKIFCRGYLHIDFSREKLKAKLDDSPSFDKISNFISKQNFWSLLFTYRIVRWPWLKKNFADTWAQQLCLSDVITQTQELKEKLSTNNHEGLVEKIIVLLNAFSPYKKSEGIVEILEEINEYRVAQLNQLEKLELKINDLNEKINLAETPTDRNLPSSLPDFALSRSAADISSQSIPRPILVN